MEPNPPTPAFHTLASRLRDDVPVGLAEAALVLAGEFQPGLDPEPALATLDALAADAARAVPADASPVERVPRLVGFLHDEAGFRGNTERYEDPRNSFLDVVLAERRGIPITLSIVHVEVGARLGLPLQGVSFPGHFLLRTPDDPPLVVDAFHGRLLGRAGCEALLQRALGRPTPLVPELLAPAGTSQIVVRMLGNLKQGWIRSREWLRALDCCERLLLVRPDDAAELRDRGLLWEQLECFHPALADLEGYLARVPNAPDAPAIRARIETLRAQASALH